MHHASLIAFFSFPLSPHSSFSPLPPPFPPFPPSFPSSFPPSFPFVSPPFPHLSTLISPIFSLLPPFPHFYPSFTPLSPFLSPFFPSLSFLHLFLPASLGSNYSLPLLKRGESSSMRDVVKGLRPTLSSCFIKRAFYLCTHVHRFTSGV